jgi:hypothetical protein
MRPRRQKSGRKINVVADSNYFWARDYRTSGKSALNKLSSRIEAQKFLGTPTNAERMFSATRSEYDESTCTATTPGNDNAN